LISYLLQENTL